MRTRLLALLSSLLFAGALLVGAPGPAVAGDEEVIELTLEQGITIEDFLKTVAKAGVATLWDPNDKSIRGKQLIGPVNLKVPRKNLLGSVRALLSFYDLVLIPVGGGDSDSHLVVDIRQTTQILKMKPEPVRIDDKSLADFEWQDGWFVTTMITAPHLTDLRDARNALARLVTGQNIGSVQEIPAARAFLVTDFAPNVAAIYRMVREIDAAAAANPPPPPKTDASRIVALRNAEASRLAPLLSTQFGAATAPPTVPPRAADEPTLRIQGDERTNSLLVDGPEEVVKRVLDAIETLDADPVGGRTDVTVVPVKLSDVRSAVATLERVIETTPELWRRTANGLERPIVMPHPESRAILIRANAPALDTLRGILRSMEEAVTPPEATPGKRDPNLDFAEKLRGTRMTLDLKDVPLSNVLPMLRSAVGVQIVLTPAAARAGIADMTVTLKVDGLPADQILDLIVKSLPARWDMREGVIYVRDSSGR